MLAPVIRGRKGEYTELLRELQTKGYTRARVDGATIRLDEAVGGSGQLPVLKKYEKHTIEVIVDRLAVKESARRRLPDSVETALGLSGGVVVLGGLIDEVALKAGLDSGHIAGAALDVDGGLGSGLH